MKKKLLRYAFVKSIPILCSYLFVSMAYGILMQKNGFAWYHALFVSLTVYTGEFQFVLTTFLVSGASVLTVALTALFMNSRQTFYSLTFVDAFQKMGKRKWYMVHTMTDETYAVNCSLELPEEEKRVVMFWVAFFSRCYWMVGTVLGAVLGQFAPVSLDGLEFCMTALFVIIFIDQWEKAKLHVPAIAGILMGIGCLVLFGESHFMLPALLLVSAFLLLYNYGKAVRQQ